MFYFRVVEFKELNVISILLRLSIYIVDEWCFIVFKVGFNFCFFNSDFLGEMLNNIIVIRGVWVYIISLLSKYL